MKQRQIISHTLLSLMLLTSGSIYSCSRQDSPPKISTPSPSEAKIDPLKTSLAETQKQLKLVQTRLDFLSFISSYTCILALVNLGLIIIIYLLLTRKRRKKVNTDTDTYSEKESPKLSAYERDTLPVLETENKQLRSELSRSKEQIKELESEKTALTQKNSLLESSNKDIQKSYSDIQTQKYALENRPTRENTAPPKYAAMIHRVNITTEEDLIAYYNSNPKVLEDSIEIVTASEESIQFKRIGGDKQIIFEHSRSGNYWLLWQPIIRDGYKCYCLVPKAELIVNQHNYNTIRDIFYCTNYENRRSSKFHLKCPAFVQKNQQGCWELIAPGEIVFSLERLESLIVSPIEPDPKPPPPLSPIDLVFKLPPTNVDEIELSDDLKNYFQAILQEFHANRSTTEQALLQLQEEIKKINEKQITPEKPTKDIQRYEIQEVVIPQPPPITEDLEFESHLYTIATDEYEQGLIKDYNDKDIENKYQDLIKVSLSTNSITAIRGGSGEKPILTEQTPSKYWIIRDKYLVPQYSALDSSTMASVQMQKLFDCPGYQHEVSRANEFTLQRTGKVQKVGDSWELLEKGVLDYNR